MAQAVRFDQAIDHGHAHRYHIFVFVARRVRFHHEAARVLALHVVSRLELGGADAVPWRVDLHRVNADLARLECSQGGILAQRELAHASRRALTQT